MKRGISTDARRRARGGAIATLFSLLVQAGFSAGTPATGDEKGEPKAYTLFLGTDLSVERDNGFHRVEDVKGGSFVIEVNNRVVRVPMAVGSVNLKFEQSLKLTESSASVADLKFDRAYTPGNDPYLKFQRNQEVQNEAMNDAELAQGNMSNVTRGLEAKGFGESLRPVGSGPGAEVNQMLATASSGAASANLKQGGQGLASTGSMDFQNTLAEGLFDAMEVSFEASAENPLPEPYLVVIARYREKEDKPGVSRNWIYAIPLGPISGKPVKVHFLQGGLPQGFEIENFQVHLYDHGEEIATNVAPKHMALTRDQAYQYKTVEYVLGHKGASLPASPESVNLPVDLRSRVTDAELNEILYVKISKGGAPQGIFLDPQLSRATGDAYLDSAVRYIHFNPALDKGKAVDGVASFKLGQVLR